MAFKKGGKKPSNSGRKKGTPNKKTAQFKDKLGNFDTVAELKFLFETCEDDDLKFAICKEFLKYEYPQRKAIEADVENNVTAEVTTLNEKLIIKTMEKIENLQK
jgi:hypothetical protein